jgi:endonuclease YncB( thermonuclease family)
MARTYQILIPLLSLFLNRVDLTDLYPLRIPVTLLNTYDGDTLLVKSGSYKFKVRLSKIDSPEKGQPFLGVKKDAGLVAKQCFQKLLQKEGRLILKIEKWDIYGRVLGDLNELSFKSIQNGCTTLYPYAEFDSKREKFQYLRALKIAKASRRGLWHYGGFLQPKIWRKLSKRNAVQRSHR